MATNRMNSQTGPRQNNNNNSNNARGSRQTNHRGRGGGRGNGRGGRGRGRGSFVRGRSRGGRGGGRHNNSYNNNQGHRIKFDPIEEIGDLHCKPCKGQSPTKSQSSCVRIAVEGCSHGELDTIYDRLMDHERTSGNPVDLLICCGDFQSLRNPSDFNSTSIPPKYQQLGGFSKYYSGEKVAPVLTLFIGGNHEASQALRELYYGGWVAPNIYYLGACGVVNYRGLRIGGISGIWKSWDYTMGHYETMPLDRRSVKSIYGVRNVDVERAKLLGKPSVNKNNEDEVESTTASEASKQPMDVFVSHDWPLGIEQHGNLRYLLRKKPYFREEIERNDLGSPPNREILDVLKPKYWFSAHLHVGFHATVVHNKTKNNVDITASQNEKSTMSPTSSLLMPSQASSNGKITSQKSPVFDETSASDTGEQTTITTSQTITSKGDESTTMDPVQELTEKITKFLALDKCGARRKFLSILNLQLHSEETNTDSDKNTKKEHHLEYDPEWLAILKNTHHWHQTERRQVEIPDPPDEGTSDYRDVAWVTQRFQEHATANAEKESLASIFEIPRTFVPTVPFHIDECYRGNRRLHPLPTMGNPQTDRLLDILQLDHSLTIPYNPELTPNVISEMLQGKTMTPKPMGISVDDENEIDIDSDSDDANGIEAAKKVEAQDENEIDIDIDIDSDGDGDNDIKSPTIENNNQDDNEIDIDDESDEESMNAVTKKARIEP